MSEAVETVTESPEAAAPATETVESSEPVESAETEAPAEAAEAAEAPADDSPSVIDWNGESDSIRTAEWFNALDKGVQEALMKGVEGKYLNWQRGYTKAFQENAASRKELDRRAKEVRQTEIRVQKWLHGDVDPLSEKQQEIDDLKRTHTAAVQAMREEHDIATEKIRTSNVSDLENAIKERDEVRAKITNYEKQVAAREEKTLEEATDRFESWLNKEAPDIVANDDAFYTLCVLCTGGTSPEDAVAMVRAKYPLPVAEPEPEPEEVPKSMELMNMGTNQSGTTSSENRSFEDIMETMRRNALAENGGIYGS